MSDSNSEKITIPEIIVWLFLLYIVGLLFIYEPLSKTTFFLCYKEKKDNIVEEFNNTLNLAKNGNLEAQKKLSSFYSSGSACGFFEKSDIKSVYWLEQAAMQGDSYSQFWLAHAWENGEYSLDKDINSAIFWYKKAGMQDNVLAQDVLAHHYEEGIIINKDYDQSLYWYLRAYKNGSYTAACKLGEIYNEGLLNVVRNDETALFYFKKCQELSKKEDYKLTSKIIILSSLLPLSREKENMPNYHTPPNALYYQNPVYISPPSSNTRKLSSAYKYYGTSSQPTAVCNDGTYSYSKGRRGVCSKHNGVSSWR